MHIELTVFFKFILKNRITPKVDEILKETRKSYDATKSKAKLEAGNGLPSEGCKCKEDNCGSVKYCCPDVSFEI